MLSANIGTFRKKSYVIKHGFKQTTTKRCVMHFLPGKGG